MKIITVQKVVEKINETQVLVEVVVVGESSVHAIGDKFPMFTDGFSPLDVNIGDMILVAVKDECAEYFKLNRI